MYQDPGSNVFNWRGEEGSAVRGQAGRAAATAPGGHSWEYQADLAAQQRRSQQLAEAQKRQQELAEVQARANQYGTASSGVGPNAFEPAPEPDPKSMYQTNYDPTSSVIY